MITLNSCEIIGLPGGAGQMKGTGWEAYMYNTKFFLKGTSELMEICLTFKKKLIAGYKVFVFISLPVWNIFKNNLNKRVKPRSFSHIKGRLGLPLTP